jgi:hypothetical protein
MEIDGFLGAVLELGDDGYETAQQIWNGDIQLRPAVIAGARGRPTCWPLCASRGNGTWRWRYEAADTLSPGMPCARAAW